MKKTLAISTIAIVNITFLFGVFANLLIYGRSFNELIHLPFEHFFSPDPVANTTILCSVLGLIAFNLNLILNRKK
jgi:hypothetical protein